MGLSPVKYLEKLYPCLAHITQTPECLDLPRDAASRDLPLHRAFCQRICKAAVEFPWYRLDGRPLDLRIFGNHP